MTKPIYIVGYSLISGQETFDKKCFPEQPYSHEGNSVLAIEPDYKPFINPVAIRRMSRIVKMGIATAKYALAHAQIEKPDAIIFGTGLGCMEDTEKFLQVLIDDQEQNSAPTSFISSTHNSVAASIALQLKCLGYNFTYVHKALSLHSALLDSILQIQLGNAKTVLAGGIDEYTIIKHRHYGLAGWWKNTVETNLDLFNHTDTTGSLSGEGAASFILSDEKNENTHSKISGTNSVFNPINPQQLKEELLSFLNEHDLTLQDIDVLISGNCADSREREIYQCIEDTFSTNTHICYYKHLSGTFYTSDVFALWMSCVAIDNNTLPDYSVMKKGTASSVNKILIFNSSQLTSNVFHLIERI